MGATPIGTSNSAGSATKPPCAGSNPARTSTLCPGGGIGIRTGLKILGLNGIEGSSPSLGTNSRHSHRRMSAVGYIVVGREKRMVPGREISRDYLERGIMAGAAVASCDERFGEEYSEKRPSPSLGTKKHTVPMDSVF